jgi:hypothetical protein
MTIASRMWLGLALYGHPRGKLPGTTGAAQPPVNTALPAITGTAQVGQNLTCSNGTWTNTPTGYTYEWRRAGTPIAGATTNSYIPVVGDVGSQLTCAVSASNAGGSATATSNATSAVIAAGASPSNVTPPALSPTNNLYVGVTASVTTGTWTNSPTGYSYVWKDQSNNVLQTGGDQYVLKNSDVGHGVKCQVTATNAIGSSSADSNLITPVIGVPANTALPVVSPTTNIKTGDVLTCTTGSWTNNPASYIYSWYETPSTLLQQSALSTYTLLSTNQKPLYCTVTASNPSGSSYAEQSNVTDKPLTTPINTVAPVLTPTANIYVGQVLSCTQGTWEENPTSFIYEFRSQTNALLQSSASNQYTVVAGDVGRLISCVVKATNAVQTGSATSNATTAVIGVPAIVTLPTLSKSTALYLGDTIACDTGAWSNTPTSYTYQWRRNGSTDIPGATTSTYILTQVDETNFIDCRVTATNASGSSAPAYTTQTEDVRWSLASQAGKQLWLDAKDAATIVSAGGFVSQWSDKSGNNHHAVQATGANQPKVIVEPLFDNKAVMDFDGLTMSLKGPLPFNSATLDFIAVAIMRNAGTSSGRMFSMADVVSADAASLNNIIPLGRQTTGIQARINYNGTNALINVQYLTPFVWHCQKLAGNFKIIKDSSGQTAQTLTGTLNSANYCIGRGIGAGNTEGQPTSCQIAEIVVFSTTLPDADREKIYGYLAWKWATSLVTALNASNPYKGAPP